MWRAARSSSSSSCRSGSSSTSRSTRLPTFFGNTLPNTNFDLGEYAWIGGPDPSGFDAIYQCYNAPANLGGSNYKRYCNKQVDALIRKADANFNSTKRTAQYQQVAKITANQLAIIPLYASPQIFVYKKALQGAGQLEQPDVGRPDLEPPGLALGLNPRRAVRSAVE